MKEDQVNRRRRARSREHLTAPEIRKFLKAAKTATRNSVRDYTMMLLLYQHGLRVSELTGLRLSDVYLTERTINIKRLKNSISGTHPLFTGEAGAIRDWLNVRERMEPDTDTLFISEQRRPLSRASVNLIVSGIAEAAGLGALFCPPAYAPPFRRLCSGQQGIQSSGNPIPPRALAA
jgi:type 1 fimbriae regulatory protein FimB